MKKYKLKLHYTADELKELKRFNADYYSPMNAIKQIVKEGVVGDHCGHLREKYLAMEYEDEFDLMTDINNAVMGTAIFPNKLYIVHDTNTNSVIYHDDINNKLIWAPLSFYLPTKKTKEEWLEINPAYEAMLEKVEDDE